MSKVKIEDLHLYAQKVKELEEKYKEVKRIKDEIRELKVKIYGRA